MYNIYHEHSVDATHHIGTQLADVSLSVRPSLLAVGRAVRYYVCTWKHLAMAVSPRVHRLLCSPNVLAFFELSSFALRSPRGNFCNEPSSIDSSVRLHYGLAFSELSSFTLRSSRGGFVTIFVTTRSQCRRCLKWLTKNEHWSVFELESAPFLALVLKKIPGLAKQDLVDAKWIWTGKF